MARANMTEQKLIPANEKNIYNVTHADLPLSCPMPGMTLWNSHPRVFLDVAQSGVALCPYCGTKFTLLGGPARHGH